jgi:hypothetical protein
MRNEKSLALLVFFLRVSSSSNEFFASFMRIEHIFTYIFIIGVDEYEIHLVHNSIIITRYESYNRRAK